MTSKFNKDYYENGINTGVSCYENYRWMPKLTIPMAEVLINKLPLLNSDVVLDYGCAKGYLVKALRDSGISCYGADISEYAISEVPEDISGYCYTYKNAKDCFKEKFDWLISKDVLEHIPRELIIEMLIEAKHYVDKMFHIVPLGDNGKFRINDYHKDITHIHAEDEQWWFNLFESNGWKIDNYEHHINGIKDKWFLEDKLGNLCFWASRK